MEKVKNALLLIAVVLMYGVAGHFDYEDAVAFSYDATNHEIIDEGE